ncbi:hypothetical protein [Pseudomonas sp. 4810-S13]|uniref:hypothetical protein n=1 Tax=Pseudomonas sp. 4810-S13 TaxID=3120822 RepID=UPI0031B6F138
MLRSHGLTGEVREQLQRLIDLTAALERTQTKILYGHQPTPDDYQMLGEGRREFGDLLSAFELLPPSSKS